MANDFPIPLQRDALGDPAITDEQTRRKALDCILRSNATLMSFLEQARDLDLPDWRLVSGAVYQTVWNALTGRSPDHGIKDFDLVYFDGTDLSYEAEDEIIRRVEENFAKFPFPVECRNQARVHLWYPQKHGISYPALSCTDESLAYYLAKTHAVAIRLEVDGWLDIAAPFGLSDLFAMRIAPNPLHSNPKSFRKKAEAAKRQWPEVEVVELL
ncbi:nucleotidyltransferase family protein [Rhizobiales bacterium]|uniref:nucleotidyltransferase family protein n=1 Tax=Hongsoonwoonella zoysiae TaxID=2821844 RepID=UPI00155F6A89|nr:nucleotidyltransferase family protein [Hongsoonwoonella zoysiae]NRG16205.1 nucleotidyltransferase family protein [Hongsoonwoonella zoysiae]